MDLWPILAPPHSYHWDQLCVYHSTELSSRSSDWLDLSPHLLVLLEPHQRWVVPMHNSSDLSRKERNDLFVIHMCICITCMYVLYTYIQFYTCNLQYAYHICMYIHTACVYCIYNHPEVDRIWGLFQNILILVGMYWNFHILSIQGWLYPIVK